MSFCHCSCVRASPRLFFQKSHHIGSINISVRKTEKHFSNSLLRRQFHSTNGGRGLHAICRLESRGILRLSGKDTVNHLQGLVTNDIPQLLEKSPSVQYCMMLNVQGRTLYDLFLYNVTKKDSDPITVLVDVDVAVKDELIKILKKYKLRKKVDISDASDQFQVWTHFEPGEKSLLKDKITLSDDSCHFHDPRVPMFANRIITNQESIGPKEERVEETEFRIHRYKWGVPEGVSDLPPGNCFPLESNLVFMNGVDFQKGCYIGQELTARTFHTGVTRKRLMPLILDEPADIESDSTITAKEKGRNAGKFRNSEGSHGLGLLRLAYVNDTLTAATKDGSTASFRTQVPQWWPSNALDV